MSDEERRNAVVSNQLLTVLRNFGIDSPCVLAELLGILQTSGMLDTEKLHRHLFQRALIASQTAEEVFAVLRKHSLTTPRQLDDRLALAARVDYETARRLRLRTTEKALAAAVECIGEVAAEKDAQIRRLQSEIALLRGEGATKLTKLTKYQRGAKVEIDNSFWED